MGKVIFSNSLQKSKHVSDMKERENYCHFESKITLTLRKGFKTSGAKLEIACRPLLSGDSPEIIRSHHIVYYPFRKALLASSYRTRLLKIHKNKMTLNEWSGAI